MTKLTIRTRVPLKYCFNPKKPTINNNRGCVLYCVAMLTKAFRIEFEIERLFELSQKYQVFNEFGINHKHLAEWLGHLFNHQSKARQDITTKQDLLSLISANNVILAVITPNKAQSYFVLIYEAILKRRHWWQLCQKPEWHVIFHDPAGDEKQNQQAVCLPVADFMNIFSGQVVALTLS